MNKSSSNGGSSSTLFRQYIQKSNLPMAQKVFQSGMVHIANTCPKTGWPSLFFAVSNNDLPMIEFLLQNGHEQSSISRDNEGNTALIIAIRSRAFDAFRLYLDRFPASMNISNKANLYPLLLVCQLGYEDLLYVLIEKGVDLNGQRDAKGNTALHHAANWGQFKCIEILLDWNIDYNAKNEDGWSAVDFAFNSNVEQFLREKISELENNQDHLRLTDERNLSVDSLLTV